MNKYLIFCRIGLINEVKVSTRFNIIKFVETCLSGINIFVQDKNLCLYSTYTQA